MDYTRHDSKRYDRTFLVTFHVVVDNDDIDDSPEDVLNSIITDTYLEDVFEEADDFIRDDVWVTGDGSTQPYIIHADYCVYDHVDTYSTEMACELDVDAVHQFVVDEGDKRVTITEPRLSKITLA